MIRLPNGNAVCNCKTDNFIYRKCKFCGEEVERCLDCKEVKASDCEHYDPSDKAVRS